MAKPFKSWTSNKSMSWGGFENLTNGYFKPMKLDNQNKLNSDYAMQKNLKPIWSKDSGLPQFFLPKFSGKDKRSSIGTQFELAPPTNPNAVIKNKGNTYEVMQRVQPKKGIQTSTGYIMEDTLFKQNKFGYTGLDTIHGMSEQYITTTNKDGIKTDTLIRGTNYANINYPSNKKIAENKQIRTDKINTVIANLPPGLSIDLREKIATAIDDKNEQAEKNKAGHNTRPKEKGGQTYYAGGSSTNADGSYSGGSKAKGAKRAKRMQSQKQRFLNDPTVKEANSIQSILGRSKIEQSWTRIGYGNRVQMDDYMTPSKNIIKDYKEKTSVNTWAKTIDPEHAIIDPTKLITVVDVPTRTTQNYSVTEHKYIPTVYAETNKDVTFADANAGYKMDLTYAKVMKKAKEKKTKYKTYYDTHADVLDHNYYGVTDDDFSAFKEHKDYLLGDISYRRSNQKEIIDRLKLDAKTIEQKDRSDNIIPVLESDIDTLDTKSTVIKKQLGEYDWQKNISQDAFGTDTIQGESHVSGVLDSYGGQVRGGNYYAQDIGNLVRKTKAYESELETKIKQQTSQIESIEPDETESLVEYFNDKSTKENTIASKEYLSKSLELTKEDRIKLEKARNASAFKANQQATISRPKKTRSRGKPSLRRTSSQGGQYKNTRTRGGQNNLGGLVI